MMNNVGKRKGIVMERNGSACGEVERIKKF